MKNEVSLPSTFTRKEGGKTQQLTQENFVGKQILGGYVLIQPEKDIDKLHCNLFVAPPSS